VELLLDTEAQSQRLGFCLLIDETASKRKRGQGGAERRANCKCALITELGEQGEEDVESVAHGIRWIPLQHRSLPRRGVPAP
jgi:hypothetical protein